MNRPRMTCENCKRSDPIYGTIRPYLWGSIVGASVCRNCLRKAVERRLAEARDYIEAERPSLEDMGTDFLAAKYVGVTDGMIRSCLQDLGVRRRGARPRVVVVLAKKWTEIVKFVEANPDATVWRIMSAMRVSRPVAMEALRAIGIDPRERMPRGIFGTLSR